MKSLKWICLCLIMVLAGCMLAGCSAQSTTDESLKETATAKQLVEDDQEALMTVDLTGGYSVEFASGAAYFYRGEPGDGNDAIAHAFLITKKEYDEEVAYMKEHSGEEGVEMEDLGDGVYLYDGQYFFPSEDGFFVKVVVGDGAKDDADSIYPRFSAHAADS